MKITNVHALLFLGASCEAVGPAAASTLGQCRAFCKALRPGVLDDVSACLAAVNLPPVPKLYHACVDGRKKAFDRACAPLCARAAITVTSFEGCQAVKKGGRKNVDWCRKGYDSILQNPEAFLVERSEKEGEQQQLLQKLDAQIKTKSMEYDLAENDLAENELVSEPVNIGSRENSNTAENDLVNEPVNIENIDTAENDLVNEPVNIELVQSESDPVQSEPDVAANGEAEVEAIEPDVAANDAEVQEIDTVRTEPVDTGAAIRGGPEGAARDLHGAVGAAVAGDRRAPAPGAAEHHAPLTLRGTREREL